MKVNFKNTAENLAIVIAIMLVTSFITYKVTIKTALKIYKQTAEVFEPNLREAILKETNAITNTTHNKIQIDKVKKSDSITIKVDSKPQTENVLTDNRKKEPVKTYKEGDTLNDGLIVINKDRLTRRQKKRLGIK